MGTLAEKLLEYRLIADRSSRHPGVMSTLKLADDLLKVPPVIAFRAIMEDWDTRRIAKEVYTYLRANIAA